MAIEMSHWLFVEHSQYYQGCGMPTVCGIGSSPHEALEDACEMAAQSSEYLAQYLDSYKAWEGQAITSDQIITAIEAYANDEPDEPGELAEIEGFDDSDSEFEFYWYCELSFDCNEDV